MYISRRFHIFWSAVAVAVLVMGMKYIFSAFEWEALSVTSFHTGILAGTIFLIGFILSSTHADYKESEKIPVDIANAVMSLHQDARLLHHKEPGFSLEGFTHVLKDLLLLLKKDIQHHGRESLSKTQELGKYFLEMEALGGAG